MVRENLRRIANGSLRLHARDSMQERGDLTQLFHDNRTALKAFLYAKLRNPDDVEEALQDVFLRLHTIAPEAEIAAPRAFLFRIAGNLAIDMLRQQRRLQQRGAGAGAVDINDYAHALGSNEPSSERSLISREVLRRVLERLEALPEKTRRVFIMHRVEGKSYAAIAAQLGVTQKAIEYHMTRALADLRIAQEED